MRPWILLTQANIAFEEHLIRFDSFEPESEFKTEILKLNPTGKVPALVDGDIVVWDSLSICEYVAEQNPEKALLPTDQKLRARARTISAEMHSSFQNLRNFCPMNVEANLAHIGQQLWNENAELRAEVARIDQIWSERPSGDSFLCGDFSIADAFYAPVVMRFVCYQLPISQSSQMYMQKILALASVQQWIDEAKQEQMYVPFDEPYRQNLISYCFAWLLSQVLQWVKNALAGLITAKQETSILITGLSNYLRIEKTQQDKIDIGFLLLSTKLFSIGAITTGDMVMISSYIMMLTTPSLMISQQINLLAGNMVAIEKFYHYFKLDKDQLNDQRFAEAEKDRLFYFDQAILQIGGKSTQAINLKFYKHKMYAVVGRTGTGAYKPLNGKLFYKDLDVTGGYSNKIFDEVAFVGQSATITSGSLRENLIYNSIHQYTDQKLIELIRYFDLENILIDHKLSLDSEIDECIKSFSGGEKQRLNILRAFLKKPKLMILDEPTSALDTKTAMKILNFLHDQIETLIVITHFKGCIELADEVVNVEKLFKIESS
ncbi:UNVERIFIED_CONTAM: export ATP-binding/permease protein [Trichonephila clavipes]